MPFSIDNPYPKNDPRNPKNRPSLDEPTTSGGDVSNTEGNTKYKEKQLFYRLINKESKLRSLKYKSGIDQTSVEPLIQEPIEVSGKILTNFPLQGRILQFGQVATKHGERIKSLLYNTSRGNIFQINQNRLIQNDVLLEADSSNIRSSKIPFNPSYIIDQAGSTDFGFHNIKYTPGSDKLYFNLVTKNNIRKNNRLSKLSDKLGVTLKEGQSTSLYTIPLFSADLFSALGLDLVQDITTGLGGFIGSITNVSNARRATRGLQPRGFLNKLNNSFKSAGDFLTDLRSEYLKLNSILPSQLSDSLVIDNYSFGPQGLQTIIRRFDTTNNGVRIQEAFDKSKNKTKNIDSINLLTEKNILGAPGTLSGVTNIYRQIDKTVNLMGDYSDSKIIKNKNNPYKGTTDIPFKNELTINNTHSELNSSYTDSYVFKKSKKNIRNNINNLITFVNNGKVNAYDDNNINNRMPIIFTIINPFDGKETKISFSAYLNDFNDTSSPSWNEISYIGRSEKFYNYSNFTRTVSFSFNIPVFNKTELENKHANLAKLYSSTMGYYNNNKLGGIIHKLKIGRYLNNEACVITNVSYSIPNDSPWDVDRELAHYIKVNINANIIHNFLPSYNNSESLFVFKTEEEISKISSQFLPSQNEVFNQITNEAIQYPSL